MIKIVYLMMIIRDAILIIVILTYIIMKNRSPLKISPLTNHQEKLKIIIRIRPVLNEEDPSQFVSLQDNDTLEIRKPGNYSYMKFNNILPPESTQKDVFYLVEDSIKQFLKGINTTIFAYGQTGAGKTYSIIGNYSPNESQQNLFNFLSSKERGILSRSLQMIMNMSGKEPHVRFFVSFYQIYNEKIYDLYNYTNVGLDIRESKNGEISIPDLVSIQVSKMQEAIQFLMIGLKNRATGSTQANAKSSRSHSIFQISMSKPDGNQTITSSLRIVDLAGSQKFKIPADLTAAEKQVRIQQLTSINGSLSCLGHCISALIDKSRTHIPFRNSKLTRILSDSLLGQGKMRFIICISPSISASAETFSTLQFANRAKRAIFDRSEKSISITKKKSESQEISNLKRQFEKEKQMRLQAQKQILQLKKQNDVLKIENNKLSLKSSGTGTGGSKIGRSQEKDISVSSKVSYYDQNKENDFKEEMLKLTIFQKNRLSQMNEVGDISPQVYTRNQSQIVQNNVSQVSNFNHNNAHNNVSNSSKMLPINKKKAEFQKKIRKFIQSDSPHRPINSKKLTSEYSFENDTFSHINPNEEYEKRGKANRQPQEQEYMDHNESQNIWDSHKNDSNEFIQNACTKMNLPQFQELKSEMQRARQELLNLRKKDNQLQQRKLDIR